MNSGIKIILLLTLSIVFNSCVKYKNTSVKKNRQFAKHIILIGSDGFGAYAIKNNKANIPNIRKMMAGGSYSMDARCVLPSSSAVNWASMIMGSGPELHGFTEWGSKVPELPSAKTGKGGLYPTIFSLIETQLPNAKKGVAYTWSGIQYLFEKEMVDLNFNGETDDLTANKALDFIVKEKPVFTFIHFSEPDNTGHGIGHDTPEYYKAVEKIDALVGEIINTLEKENMMDETIILFSSDHGGIKKGHGGKTLLEVEIPWVIYGKGISSKGKLEETIVTYDTGATIAFLLGLNTPESWRGKPITTVISK